MQTIKVINHPELLETQQQAEQYVLTLTRSKLWPGATFVPRFRSWRKEGTV